MKKTLILAIAVSLLFAGIAFGGVLSSRHDMRLEDSTNQSSSTAVCEFCHHPHRGPGTAVAGFGVTSMLLWNRNYSTTTYLPYGNTATLNGVPASVVMTTIDATNYATALCMSCHDGANANNSMIRAPRNGSVTMAIAFGVAASNLGSTLADDHPVNFQYTTENGADDIPAPTSAVWSTYPLYSGYFQCATCHDVHNGTTTAVQFMRGPVANSEICRACHTNK